MIFIISNLNINIQNNYNIVVSEGQKNEEKPVTQQSASGRGCVGYMGGLKGGIKVTLVPWIGFVWVERSAGWT